MSGNSTWLALGSALAGAAGAIIGWIISSFIGTPVRKFIDLRGEVIRRLTEYANVRARWKEVRNPSGAVSRVEEQGLSDKEIARLEEAQRVLRDLGSQMRAFAENESMAMWLVGWRYDPMKASGGLIGLSNEYDRYGSGKALHRTTVATALRIEA
jgi:hypothetical protein